MNKITYLPNFMLSFLGRKHFIQQVARLGEGDVVDSKFIKELQLRTEQNKKSLEKLYIEENRESLIKVTVLEEKLKDTETLIENKGSDSDKEMTILFRNKASLKEELSVLSRKLELSKACFDLDLEKLSIDLNCVIASYSRGVIKAANANKRRFKS